MESLSIDNGAHGTEKLLIKFRCKKVLHSAVNLLIYYIIAKIKIDEMSIPKAINYLINYFGFCEYPCD